MSELFKALQDFKQPAKKHHVTIDGTKIEVTKQQKLEVIRNGEHRYKIEQGQLVLVPIAVTKFRFAEIQELGSDPYWPQEKHTWTR